MLYVTKKVKFSAAHFYYLDELTSEENWHLFKACSNRYGHGHNYEVEAAVQGEIEPETGMIVNLKDLKTVLQQEVIDPLDHKHLNHQIAYFKDHIPTLENIATYLWERLHGAMAQCAMTLAWLKIVENDELYVEYDGTQEPNHVIYLTRRYDFAASHRLYNPEFPDEKNWEVFRECNNPNGHGHNYELEVTVKGTPDSRTGMLVDIGLLDDIVKEKLIRHVDHKHFNLDVPFMENLIPTAENIVWVFWNQLNPAIPSNVRLYRLRLLESRNNVAEYRGE